MPTPCRFTIQPSLRYWTLVVQKPTLRAVDWSSERCWRIGFGTLLHLQGQREWVIIGLFFFTGFSVSIVFNAIVREYDLRQPPCNVILGAETLLAFLQ